jgi:hypothetical protein
MKIVGFLVVGPGEADRYLSRTLSCFKRLTDSLFVVLNNADEKTKEMVRLSGALFLEDNRIWGKNQPWIKEDAARAMTVLKPDWILALDADEELDEVVTREDLENLAKRGQLAWYTYIVNHWQDEKHYLPNASFWNIRYWKYDIDLTWEKKPVHCGLAPRKSYHYGKNSALFVHHYGLMEKANRLRKVERYKEFDPKAEYKSREYYDILEWDGNSTAFDADDVRYQLLKEEFNGKNQFREHFAMKSQKIVLVQRTDGSILDIPERHLVQTLARHKDWRVVEQAVADKSQEATVIEGFEELPPIEPEPQKAMTEKEILQGILIGKGVAIDKRWAVPTLQKKIEELS